MKQIHPKPPKTGWPPGMLQDDCKGLSKWFASKPDARRIVREVGAEITAARNSQFGLFGCRPPAEGARGVT
jgi:hypothetical protein